MELIRECEVCGIGFGPQSGSQKYCSEKCRKEHRRLTSGKGPTKKPQLSYKLCKICGVNKAVKKRSMCSKCIYKRKLEKSPESTCIYCGGKFKSTNNAKYCSQSCVTNASNERGIIKTLTCVDCNKSFTFKGRTKALRCTDCRKKHDSRMVMVYKQEKDPSIKLGAGSGGNQWGENNHAWDPDADYHGHERYTGNYSIRCYKVWDKKCCLCNRKHGNGIIIDVHHINGKRDDFSIDNFIPLCRNHHSILHKHGNQLKKIYNSNEPDIYYESMIEMCKEVRAELKSRN